MVRGEVDGTEGAGGVVVGAGPRVGFGCGGETSFDGVAVDVAELFEALGFRADVEIVVTVLPELFSGSDQEL